MKKYTISGKEYLVENSQQLFERIKSENSHTKDLELQDYLDNIVARSLNSLTKHKISLPAKTDDIIAAWRKIGLIGFN